MSWNMPECVACGERHPVTKPRRPTVCIGALRHELDMAQAHLAAISYSRQRLRDLEIVVADQRRHIANLEEELLPHIRADAGGTQEAIL